MIARFVFATALGLSLAASAFADTRISEAPSASTASLPSAQQAVDGIRPQTEGFYPIWENTGFVEKHREIYLGTNGAHYGIGDVAHVGVEPINFLYRAPNAYAKFSVLQRGRWHLAVQAGGYYLMDEASRAYLSPMYSSRLDNPDFSLMLVPVTLTATYEVGDWMQLHQAATVLGEICTSGQLENQAYLGYSVQAELLAKRRHSVVFHAGEVGFWNHDFGMMGISYRYHNTWFEGQIGYFYRMQSDGNQSAPMIALGFLI